MDKGAVDKHRMTYSSGIKAVEKSKWGADKARERYGELRNPDMKAPEACYPQKLGDPNNLQGNYYDNDTPNDWRRGNGMKPNFDRGRK